MQLEEDVEVNGVAEAKARCLIGIAISLWSSKTVPLTQIQREAKQAHERIGS